MSENIIAASWRICESTQVKVGCCEEAKVFSATMQQMEHLHGAITKSWDIVILPLQADKFIMV
jgi:hypothetical protein